MSTSPHIELWCVLFDIWFVDLVALAKLEAESGVYVYVYSLDEMFCNVVLNKTFLVMLNKLCPILNKKLQIGIH